MRRRHLPLTYPLFMAAACGAGSTWMVQEENDKFTNGNNDRYYTQGFRVSEINEELSHWSFGHEINTPAQANALEPPVGDLPYSAVAYLAHGKGYLFPEQQAMASMEVKVGVIGPLALGRQIQNGFHHVINATEYRGWDSQMPNEFACNFQAEVRRRFYLDAPEIHHWDMLLRAAVDLGNIRSGFSTGMEIRFGLLDDSWGHGFLRQSTGWVDPVGTGGPREAWWWWFVDISAEVIPHSYSFDGTVFSDSDSVESRPIVLQGALGLSLRLAAGSFSFAIAHRTKDFETQDGSHSFGSVRYAYIF